MFFMPGWNFNFSVDNPCIISSNPLSDDCIVSMKLKDVNNYITTEKHVYIDLTDYILLCVLRDFNDYNYVFKFIKPKLKTNYIYLIIQESFNDEKCAVRTSIKIEKSYNQPSWSLIRKG